MTKASYRSVIIAVTLPVFLAIGNQTMMAVALPAVGRDMGELSRLSWLVIAYMFAMTIAGPVYGNLGDIFGRRRMLTSAALLFFLGSLLAVFSPSFEWLTVSRVIQGLGGGGLMGLSQALIGQTMESRQMGKAQGYVATVGVVANSLGPVLGGALTGLFGWQSLFVAVLPISALAAYLVWRLPAEDAPAKSHVFDYKGFLWLNAFVACWVVALEYLKHASAFGTLAAVAFGMLGVVFLFLLIRTERKAVSPIFPPRLMRDPVLTRCYVLTLFHGATLVSVVTFVPLYMQIVHGSDIYQSSLALMMMTVGLGLGGVMTGILISRTGMAMVFPSIGTTGAMILIASLALFGQKLDFTSISILLFATGLCIGTIMAVIHVVVQHVAPLDLRGSAAGSVTFSRSIGSVLGTAVVTVVLFGVAAQYGIAGTPETLANGAGEFDAAGWGTAFSFAIGTIAAFCAGTALSAMLIPLRRF